MTDDTERYYPPILFRIIHDGGRSTKGVYFDPTPGFEDGYLLARDPSAIHDLNTIDDHLSWRPTKTLYISLCTWRKAERVIAHLERNGARNIHIVAFDSSAFATILDAHQFARRLGYSGNNANSDHRRRLQNHLGEYLVCGGYHPDTYKLLAVVPLHDFSTWTPGQCVAELSDQIYMHTGLRDPGRLRLLLHAIGRRADGSLN